MKFRELKQIIIMDIIIPNNKIIILIMTKDN